MISALAPLFLLSALSAQGQDTLVVVADNPPVWGDAPQLIEELRIGSLEGDERYALGRVEGLVVDADGVIWVADDAVPAIRRFRPDGRFLDFVGRAGEGPGEFRGLAGIKRLPDGRIATWDPRLGRISLFGPGGDYLDAVSHREVTYYSSEEVFQVDPDGRFYVLIGRYRPPSNPGPTRRLWLKIDDDGELLDTIPVPPRGARALGGRTTPFGSMAPFTPITISGLSPQGYLWVGTSDEYALHRPLPDGGVERIERPWDPIPVRPDERAQYQERAAAFAERWDPAFGYGSDIPKSKPPYWAFRIDEEGRLWVARHTPGRFQTETKSERARRMEFENPPLEWWEPLVVDVIEPNGRFLGTIRFPTFDTDLGTARGNRVWVVELGQFDEPYVVRYRIEPSGDPARLHTPSGFPRSIDPGLGPGQ